MRILSGVSRQPSYFARSANAFDEPGIAYEIDPVYVAEVREYLGKSYTFTTIARHIYNAHLYARIDYREKVNSALNTRMLTIYSVSKIGRIFLGVSRRLRA